MSNGQSSSGIEYMDMGDNEAGVEETFHKLKSNSLDELGRSTENQYVWEKKFVGAWDMLDTKKITPEEMKLQQLQEQRRRHLRLKESQVTEIVRKGIIRFLFLILDLSESSLKIQSQNSSSMSIASLLGNGPSSTSSTTTSNQNSSTTSNIFAGKTRKSIMLERANEFVMEFFDQNRLSQMGVIVTRDLIAEKICDLTGNAAQLKDGIAKNSVSVGLPSVKNALDMAYKLLAHIPSYGSREVVILYNSISTCDPGDIIQTIQLLKKNNIRVSIVGFGGEVHILRKIAKETGGTYRIPTTEDAYREFLVSHALPPPITDQKQQAATLIRMGFPQKKEFLGMCACHRRVRQGGYICPRCGNKYCDLPADCVVCGLTLVSSPHLARSYHHLFPVTPYDEIPSPLLNSLKNSEPISVGGEDVTMEEVSKTDREDTHCFGCQTYLSKDTSLQLQCPRCKKIFCVECDLFIHESLHNCPGCE